jgi:hypothetical protein
MTTFSVSNENIESIPVFVREIVRLRCTRFASNPIRHTPLNLSGLSLLCWQDRPAHAKRLYPPAR